MVKIFFSSLLLLQFVFVLPFAVSAQVNPSAIKSAAIAMGNALVKKNSEQFLSYMHPSMIKLAGGKEKLSIISDSALKVFEQFGGKVKAAMPDISPALVIPKSAAPKIVMKDQ